MEAKEEDARRPVQIARRKLEALGITCEEVEGGSLVLGKLPNAGTPIINPLSGRPMFGICFYVEGHETLHFTDPPALAGVPALNFYSLPDQDSLRRAITSLVEERAALIETLRDRLRKFGFELKQLDRLDSVRAIIDLELVGSVTVEADEDGLRLVECTAVGRNEPVSAGGRSVDLDQFSDASDVELFLTPIVEKALKEKKPVPSTRSTWASLIARFTDYRPRVEARGASREGVSLRWLLDVVGPEFFVRGKVTLARELSVDNQPGCLDLEFRDRETISGQVVVGDELRWKGSFPAAQLRNLESSVACLLQEAAKQAAPVKESAAAPDLNGLIPPVRGEIWVMDVQVEEESPEEVRYLGLQADGGRQGAPRVLPRRTFEKVFLAHGAGYRMLVSVLAVTETHVTYQRLNIERQPVAAPREAPIAAFLAAFVAEAAAY